SQLLKRSSEPCTWAMRNIAVTCSGDSRNQSTNCSRCARETSPSRMRSHHSFASAAARRCRSFASITKVSQQFGVEFLSKAIQAVDDAALHASRRHVQPLGNFRAGESAGKVQLEHFAMPRM